MTRLLLIPILFLSSWPLHQVFPKEVPPLTGPVVDQANILDKSLKLRLAASLQKLRRNNKVQLQLFIVDSLEDEYVESYSIKVVEKWQLGGKKDSKGVLFLIAMKERKMRIEVGRGLEGDITDAMAGRIIAMVRPYFKKQDYSTGLFLGLSALATAVGGELQSVPLSNRKHRRPYRQGHAGHGLSLIFFLIFALGLFGRGRRGSGPGAGAWFLIGALSGGLGGRRGGLGGGGGSGGLWSGGGGGFSGGGASGNW